MSMNSLSLAFRCRFGSSTRLMM